MARYRVVCKKVENPKVKSIRCFLADSLYNENSLDSEDHKSNTLCWVGIQRYLEQKILMAGDVNKVIEDEIFYFRLRSLCIVDNLRRVGGRDKALKIVIIVENYIKDTIRNTLD